MKIHHNHIVGSSILVQAGLSGYNVSKIVFRRQTAPVEMEVKFALRSSGFAPIWDVDVSLIVKVGPISIPGSLNKSIEFSCSLRF